MYTLEIQKLLNRASRLDDKNKDKLKYYLDAIHIADINDDVDYAYELRHRLMDMEWNQPQRPHFIATFGWLLDAYDAAPDQYESDELLWKYKWVISELHANPEVSKAQIEQVLEDFKQRSEKEGFNLRAYYSKLLHEATDQMDAARSRIYQDKIQSYPRDYISDCEACEMDSDVLVSLLEGNFDEAHSKATPLLEEAHTCAKVPFITRVNLAYYAYKSGRADLARQLAGKIEEELADREEDAYLIHSIGYFLTLIFWLEERKGWEYFQHFVKFTTDTDASTLFFFSMGMAEGLSAVDKEETVLLSLPAECAIYTETGYYRKGDIYEYYHSQARELGAKFDARNGNTNFSRQIAG